MPEKLDESEHPLDLLEEIIVLASHEEDGCVEVLYDQGEPYYRWSLGGRDFQIAFGHPSGVKMLQVVEESEDEVVGYNILRFFYYDRELFAVYKAFISDSELDDMVEDRITAQAVGAKDMGLPTPNEQDLSDFVDYMSSVIGVGPYAG